MYDIEIMNLMLNLNTSPKDWNVALEIYTEEGEDYKVIEDTLDSEDIMIEDVAILIQSFLTRIQELENQLPNR